jgi:Raf kinase inhibitor-like YbhB/YbcL family protein
MRLFTELAFLLILAGTLLAQGNSAAGGGPSLMLALSSSAFSAGGEIPRQYTCTGSDISPPLQWSGAPEKTASFALILDDPDAPHGTWVHWVLWNIPANRHALPEGIAKREQLEGGMWQGRNDFHKNGYNGPCPPGGSTHRYFFHLYALNTKLDLSPRSDRSALDAAMQGHVLAQAEYMGTFHK